MKELGHLNFNLIVNRAPRRKAPLGVAVVLAVSGFMTGGAQAEGKVPFLPTPIPYGEFNPVVLSTSTAQIEEENLRDVSQRIPVGDQESVRKQAAPVVWQLDPEISFFGPSLYGRRTACGQELTTDLIGVASRTLLCGTSVIFKWEENKVTAPVVDWGPAEWTGRMFDLTGGACVALDHCFTGPINYRIDKQFKTAD